MTNNYIVTIKTNTLTATATTKARTEEKAIAKVFKKFSHFDGPMVCTSVKKA